MARALVNGRVAVVGKPNDFRGQACTNARPPPPERTKQTHKPTSAAFEAAEPRHCRTRGTHPQHSNMIKVALHPNCTHLTVKGGRTGCTSA